MIDRHPGSQADASLEDKVQYLMDRQQVVDVLLRYASTIDTKDYVGLRATLTDDVHGNYGGAEVDGGDNLLAWVDSMTATKTWQHHMLSVYHVDFVSSTEARTLTYHTSHQIDSEVPGSTSRIIARYKDTVRKQDGVWRISDKLMEIGWVDGFTAPG